MSEEKDWFEIRFRVPKKVRDTMLSLITVEVGDYIVQVDRIGFFARECMYRGLAQVLELRSKETSSGYGTTRQGDDPVEVSQVKERSDVE